MSGFKFEKSKQANVIKSIRFPEELNDRINEVVARANKGKKTKEYSFNGFVCSACEWALEEMNKNK